MSLSKKTTQSRRPLAKAARPVIEGLEARQFLSGTLTLVNPFLLPASDRLIFNAIGNIHTYSTTNIVHNEQTLTLKNTGAAALTISSITPSGPFALINAPTGGYTNTVIAAGASLTITVEFTQSSVPAHTTNETDTPASDGLGAVVGGAAIGGSLTIVSSDTTTPTKVVTLEGYYQQVSNNNEEPNLSTIVNTLAGYQTNLGLPAGQVDFTEGTTPTYYGSEVVASSWETANSAVPVTVDDLAEFHTQGNTATLYWYAAAAQTTSHKIFTSTAGQGQTVLATNTDSGGYELTSSFTPTGAFGLRVDDEYSNDAINVANGNTGGGGHHFRFFPLVDENGNAVPNTYIVAMDYGVAQAENFDFQDNVYIVSNIRPATTPDTPTAFAATNGVAPVLTWTASHYTPVTYDVYRATTAAGPFTLVATEPSTTTTYTDTTAPASGPIYYQLTAVDATQSPAAASAPATASANVGPVAANYAFADTAGVADTFDALADVTDSTGATILPATLAIATAPNAGGTAAVVDATSGDITYTPASTFSGTETFTYTVADSNGVRSAPGTVTFTVAALATTTPTPTGTPTPTPTPSPTTTPTTTPTLANYVGQTLVNTAVTLPVLSAATSDVTLAATSPVTIVAPASDGSAVANADGSITYTPSKSFVGGDSFTYKATSAAGVQSAAVTVDVNVGVSIGSTATYKTLAFTDEDGTAVTVSLNKGVANVYFDGTGTYTLPSGKGKTVTVSGGASNGLHIRTIALTGTTAASTLSITGARNGAVTFGGLYDAGTLGTLKAKTSNLTVNSTGASSLPVVGNALPAGYVSLGGVKSISLATATDATLVLGGAGVTSTALAFTGAATATAVTSAVPITKLTASKWTAETGYTPGPITAPSIATLTVPGEFDADLSLTGAVGRVADLGAVRVGPVDNGTWTVMGNAKSLTLASASALFGGVSVVGALTFMTVASGNLASDVTAGSIGTLHIAGTMSGDIHTTGNLNTLTVGGLSGSAVTVGTSATLATVATANIGTATLGTLKVTGRTSPVFNDATVIADKINSATTGQVNASTTSPEGIAVGLIKSAAIGVDGGTIKLSAKDLVSESALTTALGTKTLGTFTLDIV
jgi:hypothetical protein